MKQILACLAAVAIVAACQDAAEKSDQASVQQQAAVVGAGQPDSARAFVQRFYDWYLTTKDGAGYDSLLTSRGAMLGDSLLRAFQADVAVQRVADTIPGMGINSLSAESDIFLNANDPCEHYATQGVTAAGPSTFAVTVAGDCGEDRRPNIEVYIRRNPSGWQIEDIKDPTHPSYDLVRDLVAYHEEGPALPDSVTADWLTYHGDGFTIRYPKEATLARAASDPRERELPGMEVKGPTTHAPRFGPTDGPAYRLLIASVPNPHGWSAEQWIDSLRSEALTDPDSSAQLRGELTPPDTVMLGTTRALHRQANYCGDCEPHQLYVATPKRMIVVYYVLFDFETRGDPKAQARLYQAIVSTLRPSE